MKPLHQFALATIASTPLQAALVSHYTFESGTYSGTGASLLVSDVTGNTHNLDSGGSGNGVIVDAERGSVLNIVNSGMVVVDSGISITSSYSLAFWLKSGDNDGYVFDQSSERAIISIGGSVDAFEYAYYNGGWRETGTAQPNDGEWHHYAFVLDDVNDTMSVYLDGTAVVSNLALAGDGVEDLNGAASQVFFSHNGGGVGGTGVKVGQWDDVRLYDEVLTTSEIEALAIPEPSVVSLLALTSLGFSRRRRPSR